MKAKEMVLSIVLNLFLGYLWILFSDHIVSKVNLMNNTFIIGGLILLIGTLLFLEIAQRITPFNNYKFTHPVKLVGYASFGLIVVFHLLVFNII
ncbi:hypothetical protein [Heyndrickxia oleronia]|jgi:hypothetical protein|uniref:hypothetical protein n=1 Tax=Heyndrickxia oleronia TaxID=38875 RepID=UPI002432BD9D|nr:hypothetical protein [Heyndrickxia oleronia]MCI1593523.1 hypothetical protein [Heyndrickxia oleronia]MCI1614631.1 hypothetical protein [Heyndrickxia oleronia]MCI1762456.1 hypothetical protein [Heyndrickxia oleronia]